MVDFFVDDAYFGGKLGSSYLPSICSISMVLICVKKAFIMTKHVPDSVCRQGSLNNNNTASTVKSTVLLSLYGMAE